LAEAPLPRIRKYIFDYFEAYAVAPVLEQVMREFNLSSDEAADAFRKLQDAHHISLVAGTTRILMAFPFSAVTTPFRTAVGERTYFANCAWDTVALHVMLEKDARVESYCHHCAEPVEIALREGRVVSSQPPEPLIFLSMPVAKWYDNLVNTCSNNMVYFASREHMDSWLAANPGLKGEALTPAKMAEVCRPLAKGRMELGYLRPPKEELMAYWDSVGMTSDFWDF